MSRSSVQGWAARAAMLVAALTAVATAGVSGVTSASATPAATRPAVAPAAPAAAAAAPAAATDAGPGSFHVLPPTRLLDTRTGLGATKAAIPANASITLQVTGHGGIPTTGAAAATLNLAVTGATRTGYLTAYPTGTPRPTASTLNFTAGTTIANLTVTKLGTNGRITLHNASPGTIHLVADTAGYHLAGDPTTAGAFAALPPTRLLDTRTGLGATKAAIPANASITLQVTGHGGIPTTGAAAATLNLAVTGATRTGYLTAYPTGTPRPTASTLNFTAGTTIANLTVTKLGTNGRITLHNASPGTIHLVADTAGYHLAGDPTTAGAFAALPPTRLLDTRTGLGATKAAIPANASITLQVTGHGGIPTTGAAAATLNLAVTGATRTGYLTAYPTGTPRPTASTLNFTAGTTIANLTVTKLGTNGRITLHNASPGTIHLVADTAGYHLAPAASTSTWQQPVLADPEQGGISDVACLTPTWCLVVDQTGNAWTFDGTTWQRQARAPHGAIEDLTCVSATWCLAVTYDRYPMVFDGTAWSEGAPLPGTATPAEVSCPTTTFCAVSSTDGTVWQLAGATWSATQVDTVGMLGISCPTTTFCMVAGNFGRLWVWTGGAWVQKPQNSLGQDTEVDCPRADLCIAAEGTVGAVYVNGDWAPAEGLAGLNNGVTSVSCPTDTFCRVTDNFGGHVDWNGAWQAAVADGHVGYDTTCPVATACFGIDAGGEQMVRFADTETTWMVAPGQGRPFDVSCSSRGFCGVADESLASVFLRNGQWGAPLATQGDQSWPLSGIACPADDFCAATTKLGTYDMGNFLRFDGTAWSQEFGYVASADIDCTSATHCVAITNGSSTYLWDGTAWANGPGTGTWFVTAAIDCTSSTFCASVSRYGLVSFWNGAAWTAPVQVGAYAYSDWSISCAAPGSCAIAGINGTVSVLAGGSWSAPTDITTGDVPLSSISCPAEGLCLATAGDGRVHTLTGGAWTSEVVDPNGELSGIDCVDPDYCVVVSAKGYATVRS